jgi:anthranilate/para-aminobenzoate synthase component II
MLAELFSRVLQLAGSAHKGYVSCHIDHNHVAHVRTNVQWQTYHSHMEDQASLRGRLTVVTWRTDHDNLWQS